MADLHPYAEAAAFYCHALGLPAGDFLPSDVRQDRADPGPPIDPGPPEEAPVLGGRRELMLGIWPAGRGGEPLIVEAVYDEPGDCPGHEAPA